MRVTITQKGADPNALILAQIKEMTTATRIASREVAKVGVKAFKGAAGVSSFAGYPLKFKAKKVTATATEAHIHFQASPVGFWVMVESGARPHPIKPRKGKVLRLGADTFYTQVNHPGMSGSGAYSRGEAAAVAAMDEIVEEVYGDALEAR